MATSPRNPIGLAHPLPSPSQPVLKSNDELEVVSTPEIQRWMSTIEQCLNDVCSTAADGKLNTEQKLKISNLCRKIGHGTSQMAVSYQSLKQRALQASNTIEVLKENCNLTENISGLKQTIEASCTVGNSSFADAVKKGSNSLVRRNNLSSVAIYPKDKLQTSDDTKNLVQKIIHPEKIKLQVRGVRKTKNGGVIISTETKQDAEKLKQAVQHSTTGLTADEPHKRKPRIVVIGIPASLAENDVFHCIFEQNVTEKIPSLSFESFLTSCKLSHKSGKKDAPSCNYIIEVTANIRKALIAQGRLFINWTSCPVKDFTLVTRCYKCHQYGHAAKSCRDAIPTCGLCGAAGHSMPDCTKRDESPKCATCSRFKKPSDHKTGDSECPARKIAEYRYINSIDYDGA